MIIDKSFVFHLLKQEKLFERKARANNKEKSASHVSTMDKEN